MESEVRKRNIRKPVTYSARDMYNAYKRKNPTSEIPYWMYKEIIGRFNKKVSDAVIFGQVLNLGNRLGHVLIKKIRRNYLNPIPDWGASNKRKADLIASGVVAKDQNHPEGEEWISFYTDPWFLRFAWVKKRICKVKNSSVYKFVPTSNRSKTAGDNDLARLGNKGKLTLANKVNPTLHMSYEQVIRN